MIDTLQIYSTQAVRALRDGVDTVLDWYYEPGGEPPKPQGVERAVRSVSRLAGIDLSTKLTADSGSHPSRLDAKNAVVVYRELAALTPHEAADERLWVHLCHGQCAQYVARRWLRDRPDDAGAAANKVRNHFFAAGSRGIVRDNGLSRLWWLGYIAHRVEPANAEAFLSILMHRQDIRSALIERPSVSMNISVLSAVYGVMKEEWESHGDGSRLFQRDVFRDWMIRLNRRGGILLLDALPDGPLGRLVRAEAAEALGGGNDG